MSNKSNGKKVVLVVDDDPSVRESMSLLLDVKGYSVVQAENGQKALAVLGRLPNPPCLIVLDLAMPVLDGYGFLKLRAQDPVLRDIPVAVVSGNARSQKPLKEIDVFLRKPVDVRSLIDVVAQHC
jgi:CheY-like chemotaxis protein